jgi:hippurate hydrolase
VINDATLTGELVPVLQAALGNEHVIEMDPLMVGEDFGRFGLTAEQVPISLMWLGGVPPEKLDSGEPLPGLHTAYFYPDFPATIRTGVEGMVRMLTALMGKR